MSKRESGFLSPHDPPSPKHDADTTMRFTLFWRHKGDKHEVKETYEKVTNAPDKWSRETIDWFNATLRPHERKRVFIRCEVEGEVTPAEHKWFKVTAMTKITVGGARHGSMYDAMKCKRCGVTGKRYGVQEFVRLDSKWRNKVYKRCDTTMAANKTQ